MPPRHVKKKPNKIFRDLPLPKKRPLEKHIERKVCDYASEKGCLVYKFTSPARAAVPDRMIVTPKGRTFFIEFKRHGEKPTPQQEREHTKLRGHGIFVFVVDDVAFGKGVIDGMMTP